MSEELLPCVEINPPKPAVASVVWLHGLGADGHDFEAIVPALRLPESLPIRFVFPHAPRRPVTLNGGMVMRAWYDIYGLGSSKVDLTSIETSADQTRALLQRELDLGIPSERIVLAGFSQGGVIALHTGLRYEKKLAGILALSTYLPTIETLPSEKSESNLEIPIMIGHGVMDSVLPVDKGKAVYTGLTEMGYHPTWSEYMMGHEVCLEEIEQVSAWLVRVLE